MNLNLLSTGWLGVAAVLLTVIVWAACGSDPTATPVPTATPEPTVTPAPTATPEPTQPPMMMKDLIITPETTGQELVARISEPESACLSSAMGAANFQLFQGAPLVLAAENESAYSLFADCLENDNLLVLGVGLMSAQLGGWSEDSLGCVTNLTMEHPELVYMALKLEEEISDPSHPTEVHSIILDIYQCLDTTEKVGFQVAMMYKSLEATPFTGQHFLDALAETEVECLKTSLPAPVFSMIANAPSVAGGELGDAPPELMACLSPESLTSLPGEIMALGMGAAADESRACVVEFSLMHSHYVELVRSFAEQAEDLTPEDFVEIAEDGFKLFNCLTDEELALFQQTYIPFLVP